MSVMNTFTLHVRSSGVKEKCINKCSTDLLVECFMVVVRHLFHFFCIKLMEDCNIYVRY